MRWAASYLEGQRDDDGGRVDGLGNVDDLLPARRIMVVSVATPPREVAMSALGREG